MNFAWHCVFSVWSYLALCSYVFLKSCFSIVIISLEEEKADLYASRAFICLFCMPWLISVLSSSSWCQGLTVACDCGTVLTFPLTFFTTFLGTQQLLTHTKCGLILMLETTFLFVHITIISCNPFGLNGALPENDTS